MESTNIREQFANACRPAQISLRRALSENKCLSFPVAASRRWSQRDFIYAKFKKIREKEEMIMPEFAFCRVFAVDKNGREKYEELWCRSFSDMYEHLRNKGLRLIKYICY